MANFLISTPNSLRTGTDDTIDLFVLNTALGATVNAAAGADEISAVGTNFVNANLQGAQGNDSIYLTAAGQKTLAVTTIAVGAGNDLVAIDDAGANNSTIVGGGGNDTIQFSGGDFSDLSINGNLGSDLISAYNTFFARVLAGGGGDNDTINLGGAFFSATINGGGGNDRLTFVRSFCTSVRIEGDTLGDSEFFGNDTIRFVDGTFSGGSINGGQGNDLVQVSAVIGTGVLVEGNQGTDSIFLNAFVASGATFLGGGAGNDTIAVSGALTNSFGTIQGGGGLDVINVSGGGTTGGFIFGGAEADAIGLGTLASGAVRSNDTASGVYVAYASFAESNLAGFDTISATFVGAAVSGGGAFMVTQSAVNFSVAAFDRAGVVSGGATGNATFTAGFDNSLTARAEALDLALVQGQAVVFANGAGTNFLFVQGGASGSGAAGDLVVQLNAGFNPTSGGLFAVNNSALKVVIA